MQRRIPLGRTGRRRTTSAQRRSVSVFRAKFVDAQPPLSAAPVRATAAKTGWKRRLWMFGGRNGIGGEGNFKSNSRIIIVSEGLSAGQVCLRL